MIDPVSLGLMGGGLVSGIVGLFGGNDADEYTKKAVEELIKVKIPDPQQQKLALERFRSAGELSPELERAIAQDPSSFEKIVQNQKYTQAQDRALSQLQSLGEEGGLSLSDKADLQEQMIANANKDKANRDAIADDMARRGQLGSGMALQAQLAGAQASGDRDAQSRLRILGDARDRALKSIMGAGELAGTLGNQDYQRQSDLAQARDRIAQFNTQNAQNVQMRNMAARNAAQASNLQNRQNLMNANTELSNKEQQYNKELQQQQFDNEMRKATGVANAYTGQAAQANKDSDRNRQAWAGLGSAFAQQGATVAQQNNWDEWLKAQKSRWGASQ